MYLRPRTLDEALGALAATGAQVLAGGTDVFPALGSKLMHEITPPDVLAMVRKIEARGALDISRRAPQQLAHMCLDAADLQTARVHRMDDDQPVLHAKPRTTTRPTLAQPH